MGRSEAAISRAANDDRWTVYDSTDMLDLTLSKATLDFTLIIPRGGVTIGGGPRATLHPSSSLSSLRVSKISNVPESKGIKDMTFEASFSAEGYFVVREERLTVCLRWR